MICDKYDALSHYEKVQFMGKLCHASQSDDTLFEIAQEIIRLGGERRLFDKVSFPNERRDLQPIDNPIENLLDPPSIKELILKKWKDAPLVGEPLPKKEQDGDGPNYP